MRTTLPDCHPEAVLQPSLPCARLIGPPSPPAHLLHPCLQAPETLDLRRARLAMVRTHNELARLELRDENHAAAEAQFKASMTKCEQIYGEMSPEGGALWVAARGLGLGTALSEVRVQRPLLCD